MEVFMKFGICGYGNLGKAVERLLKKNNEQIIGIFSRRNNLESVYGTKIFDYEKAKDFSNDINVLFMCGGSQEDLLWQTPQMCKHFNVIDTFDTHAKIETHKQNLEKVAKESGHVAIYSCGWDPGIFSLIRGLSKSIFTTTPQTFWGKGVSQGHSEALRNIKGIADAIQFTVPNQKILQQMKSNPTFCPQTTQTHERHCFITLDNTRDLKEIENEIKQTENYFKGQKVFVNVCSQEELNKLKQKMSHRGIIFAGDKDSSLEFSVKMENNPDFTAKIMYAYSNAIPKLSSGAYNVLDIPAKYLEKNNNFDKIL